MRIQKISLLLAGMCALVTAAAHALVGQAHLNRVLGTSVENIDSAVMFAVWHMVTIVLVIFSAGLLLLARCKQKIVVKVFSLATGIVFFLFGVVFIVTSFLYSEPAIQWIPMLIVFILCVIAYVSASGADRELRDC